MLTESTLISLGTAVITLAVSWGMDRSDAKRASAQIGKLETWKEEHEKDSNNVRRELEKQIAELAAAIKVNATQYGEILRRLEELNQEVKRIAKRDED